MARLEIEKDVNLEILIEFGFVKKGNSYYESEGIYIHSSDREIGHIAQQDLAKEDAEQIDGVLFDLFQAGLVEKVE